MNKRIKKKLNKRGNSFHYKPYKRKSKILKDIQRKCKKLKFEYLNYLNTKKDFHNTIAEKAIDCLSKKSNIPKENFSYTVENDKVKIFMKGKNDIDENDLKMKIMKSKVIKSFMEGKFCGGIQDVIEKNGSSNGE